MTQRSQRDVVGNRPILGDPDIEPLAARSFEAFYHRNIVQLVVLARALGGSNSTADDLAQETMLAAYRRWDFVSELERPEMWIRRVCSNLAVSQIRRRAAEVRALRRLGSRRQTDADMTMTDEHQAFWAEVRRLPRRQAQAVALHYIYDLSVADVAEILGCSEGSVKVHLFRGRSTIAGRLHVEVGETP